MFDAYDVSLQLARTLRPQLGRLRSRDTALHKQLTRALSSVPLNLSEGRRRTGGDRGHLFRIASGSAAEVQACLDVAEALGHLRAEDLEASLELLDRLQAMCWRLSRPRE
jgi:four helix bundle protein